MAKARNVKLDARASPALVTVLINVRGAKEFSDAKALRTSYELTKKEKLAEM